MEPNEICKYKLCFVGIFELSSSCLLVDILKVSLRRYLKSLANASTDFDPLGLVDYNGPLWSPESESANGRVLLMQTNLIANQLPFNNLIEDILFLLKGLKSVLKV